MKLLKIFTLIWVLAFSGICFGQGHPNHNQRRSYPGSRSLQWPPPKPQKPSGQNQSINEPQPGTGNQRHNEIDPNKVYYSVEVQAEYHGGDRARLQWLRDNIQWPRDGDGRQLHGEVELEFVIERDGSVSNVVVTYSDDTALNSAAINVISSMPKWYPAKVKNQPVRSPMGMTLFF